MTLAELTPDMALKALLKGKVTVDEDAKAVVIYAQGEMPNKGVGEDYISLYNNGVIRSLTEPLGYCEGNIALSVNCKLYSDRTFNLVRLRKIVAQCEAVINERKPSQGFFFRFDPANVITPPTANDTTGYAAMTLNVAWHTT